MAQAAQQAHSPPLPFLPPPASQVQDKSTKEARATTSIATRAQIVALKECGVSNDDISKRTGVCRRQIQYMWAKAVNRGWQPGMKLEDAHLKDAKRPGRPKKGGANGANGIASTQDEASVMNMAMDEEEEPSGFMVEGEQFDANNAFATTTDGAG